VGEADTAAAAAEKARQLLPDIILLDINLPDDSGLVVAGTVRRECPYTRIVMLTVVEDDDTLMRALKEGAHGYVLKGVSAEQLVEVVRSVYRGETYVTPSMAGRLLTELTTPSENRITPNLIGELTSREREILDLVGEGKTNKEIAAELHDEHSPEAPGAQPGGGGSGRQKGRARPLAALPATHLSPPAAVSYVFRFDHPEHRTLVATRARLSSVVSVCLRRRCWG
jgi:DNA-binding NarL/FixJ family response regulator